MKFPNLHHRILYAEDNEDNRELVSIMCRMSDIEVTTAETVAETWRLAQSESFDLYLLDSWFPDDGGLELCRRLRVYASHTPILFFSGDAAEIDKRNGFAAGADQYLTKSYLADLGVTIRQSIERSENSVRQASTSENKLFVDSHYWSCFESDFRGNRVVSDLIGYGSCGLGKHPGKHFKG